MRNRRYIPDSCNCNASGLQGTNGRFPSTARSLDIHFNPVQSVAHCPVGGISRSYLSSVRRSFPGAFESSATGTSPGNNITLHISDGDNRIVKRRLNKRFALANLLVGLLLFGHC